MLKIFSLFYALAFLSNGVVILNSNAFLNKVCLPLQEEHRATLSPTKRKLVDFIRTTRAVCESPLIVLNILFVLYEILLG